MLKKLATFLENIRACDLLRPEQLEQIMIWGVSDDPDPQAIAQEIVQRGWLTAFQVKMFWKGLGSELILNQYVLMDRLGEGGMGEVYRAKHRRMDRDVALKVIRKERLQSPDAIKRFGREIQAAAQLAHENIVMAYDADQANGQHFFAMEYVEGTNLAKLVKEAGPLRILQACDCIRQAAIGLEHAHERNMIHRDIKPSNLLLGKNGVVKILDMGLARLLEGAEGEQESRITREGLVVGTPDFVAPEQARNARTSDIRADIYALGCTFYYLLCGHPPYPGGTPTEKLLRHSVEPIPPLTRPDVPAPLIAILHQMMAKKPEDRYQTPVEVAYALQPYTGPAAGSSSRMSRPAPTFEPLVASPPAPVARAASKPSVVTPVASPRPALDDRFHLPPPAPRHEHRAERTRWNLPIALGAGFMALCVLAGGIYLLFIRNSSSGGPNFDKEYKNIHDMSFVLIAPGSFDMGSPEDEVGRGMDEGPVHPVKISRHFYMGVTEMTLRQYFSVVKRYPWAYKEEPEDLDMPVTFLTIKDVLAFIEALNRDPNNRKPGWEYRLPTEAEWEYACRAGNKARFHTGDSIAQSQANVSGAKPTPGPMHPALFTPNAWGLHDMHGNVAEWVFDYYDEAFYSKSSTDDPKGPELRKSIHVARGGSYSDLPDGCRCARRKPMKEETAAADLGFRIVMVQIVK